MPKRERERELRESQDTGGARARVRYTNTKFTVEERARQHKDLVGSAVGKGKGQGDN